MVEMSSLANGALADLPLLSRSREERLAELGRDLVSAAYLRGDFILSSGARSQYYFDKYLFETKPGILRQIARFAAEMIPPGTDRITGPELGGVALACALSLETGLPFVIIRKGIKDYGTSRWAEGEIYAGEKVVVIEDVVSTATQAIGAARRVSQLGAQVLRIIGIVDREQGGPENCAAAGFQFQALFKRTELGL